MARVIRNGGTLRRAGRHAGVVLLAVLAADVATAEPPPGGVSVLEARVSVDLAGALRKLAATVESQIAGVRGDGEFSGTGYKGRYGYAVRRVAATADLRAHPRGVLVGVSADASLAVKIDGKAALVLNIYPSRGCRDLGLRFRWSALIRLEGGALVADQPTSRTTLRGRCAAMAVKAERYDVTGLVRDRSRAAAADARTAIARGLSAALAEAPEPSSMLTALNRPVSLGGVAWVRPGLTGVVLDGPPRAEGTALVLPLLLWGRPKLAVSASPARVQDMTADTDTAAPTHRRFGLPLNLRVPLASAGVVGGGDCERPPGQALQLRPAPERDELLAVWAGQTGNCLPLVHLADSDAPDPSGESVTFAQELPGFLAEVDAWLGPSGPLAAVRSGAPRKLREELAVMRGAADSLTGAGFTRALGAATLHLEGMGVWVERVRVGRDGLAIRAWLTGRASASLLH